MKENSLFCSFEVELKQQQKSYDVREFFVKMRNSLGNKLNQIGNLK
jgi:hypothetical protein